ncbi:MAG: murein biosynthesis integral membrane protein MurJ [Chloroflexota bacterium]|nr:murein biosynthesis integral membrane protein MurJ [Chloroflexota bacterium]
MSHIARSALIIAIFIGLEKLLGFVRQVIIARQFGLTAELDAFNAANNLPDAIFVLISGGALAIAFIPVLTQYLEQKGRPVMWEMFSLMTNLLFIFTALFAIIVAIFASQLVNISIGIAPGFDAAQKALVVDLMRLNLIATLIFSIAGMVIAGLQANQHFFLPALARSMYDVGTLIGVVILAPQTGFTIGPITLPAFGLGVYGLVYGTIIGAALFLLIQLPGLIHFKFRWSPLKSLRHLRQVGQVLRVALPRIGTVFFILLALIYIPDNIASRLPEGSVTALVYGWLFMQAPETLIGTAIATALLPSISAQIVRDELARFTRSLNHSMRAILALTIPVSVLLAIALPPIVNILGFDTAGTELVVWTSRLFLVGLMGHALLEISARGFYSQQDAITPLWAAGLMLVTFTVLSIVLSRPLGAPGIALANAIAFTAEALLLWALLNRQFPGVANSRSTLRRVLPGTLIAGAVAFGILLLLPAPALISSAAALVVGGLVVLPFIWPEIKLLIKL